MLIYRVSPLLSAKLGKRRREIVIIKRRTCIVPKKKLNLENWEVLNVEVRKTIIS